MVENRSHGDAKRGITVIAVVPLLLGGRGDVRGPAIYAAGLTLPTNVFQVKNAIGLSGVKFKNFYDIHCPYLHLGRMVSQANTLVKLFHLP